MVSYPLPVALYISGNLLDRPRGAVSTIGIIGRATGRVPHAPGAKATGGVALEFDSQVQGVTARPLVQSFGGVVVSEFT